MPDIYDLAEQYRRELIQREKSAARAMIAAYRQAWARIQEELTRLDAEYTAMVAAGEQPGITWIYQYNRLGSFRAQVEKELGKFSVLAEGTIHSEQRAAIAQAPKQAKALAQALVSATWDTFDDPAAVEYMVGLTQTASPLHALLVAMGVDGAREAEDALVQNMLLGYNPRQTARELRKIFGGVLSRALTIARTEVLRAHRLATRESYRANSDIVRGWMWHSSADQRTCGCCWAMHGTKHGLDEELDGHPNCRCAMIPIIKGVDFPVQPGGEIFQEMSAAKQINVLGPAKWQAWQTGQITLDEDPLTGIVGRKYSPVWGSMRYERSLKSMGLSSVELLQEYLEL